MTAGNRGDMSAAVDPAISVIVPTHNRASLLPRALASVLAQQFAPFAPPIRAFT